MVGRDVEREPHRRRERGLEPARLRGAQPLHRQPEPRAERGEAIERFGLVAIARHHQRADRAVARIVERGAEGRVAREALAPELQQFALAELGLGDRRQHAGGDVPRAGRPRIQHHDARAGLASGQRTGEPDRATTDDGDVEAL